jgi:hypothetical protein
MDETGTARAAAWDVMRVCGVRLARMACVGCTIFWGAGALADQDAAQEARPSVDGPARGPAAAAPTPRPVDFSADVEVRKRYGAAALEIFGFEALLNEANRHWSGVDDYDSNFHTIKRNLRSHWGIDDDPFSVNQLGHPYQGSIYHGIARSSGLSYWESAGYTFAGSVLWEIAGEKTRPSANDQVASGIGGSFLGEALFRMASLLLENREGPRFWREIGATAISPPTGFNHWIYGDDHNPVFSSHNAEYYSRAQIGLSRSFGENDAGNGTSVKRNEAVAEFAMDYGLPGKAGYEYERPFDYFAFQATTSTASAAENVTTRGSLLVRPYELGPRFRGIVGLYGGYDYLAPPTFRLSSTSLAFGTTGQWNASNAVTMQGSALFGVGYTAVGSIDTSNDRDYQYGVTPEFTLAWRTIVGNLVSFDVGAHEYFVTHVGSNGGREGHGNVARLEASMTYRLSGPHAVSLRYLGNFRTTTFADIGSRHQSRSTIGIFYTFLGHDRFGATSF